MVDARPVTSHAVTQVHIVNRMAPGGIETLVLDLMRGAASRPPGGDGTAAAGGARIEVISLEGRREDLIAAWPSLGAIEDRLHAFAAPDGRRFNIVPAIARHLARVRPAEVFVHHIGPLLYGGLAARLARASRLVHVEHDAWHYGRTPSHARILRWCERLLRPSHFAVSRPVAERVRELVPQARIEVVPPGIDIDRFRPGDRSAARWLLGLDLQAPVVGTVGRLNPVKGQVHLIEAAARLGGDVQFVLVGEGAERVRLEDRARALGVFERCHFLGHRDDIDGLLAGFDVFCLPSLQEGLPRAVLEAQASGVPVVASDVGALSDAVAPGTGRLVPPGDAGALAAALEAVLADPRGRAERSAETRAFVASRFSLAETRRHYDPVRPAPSPRRPAPRAQARLSPTPSRAPDDNR